MIVQQDVRYHAQAPSADGAAAPVVELEVGCALEHLGRRLLALDGRVDDDAMRTARVDLAQQNDRVAERAA